MNQKIIITGWAWFIGSNFLNSYVIANPEIDFINVDALTYAGKLSNIKKDVVSAPNYFFEQCDIRDLISLEKIYEKYKPTDIIHFAAESHVDNSIESPRIFTETNVIGTQNLLDLHRQYWLNRFHHISTDEVYGDLPHKGLFTEATPINPSSPYSASKASSDMLVKAYIRTYDIDAVITRCTNNYGPGQDKEKLIPRFIGLLQAGKHVTLYGDGSNVRDWLHVDDHCIALWEVFRNAKRWSIYNIWDSNERTNLEVTRMILAEMGKWEDMIEFVTDRPWHDQRYAIDATKIKMELGWVPQIQFEDGLAETIRYYLTNKI